MTTTFTNCTNLLRSQINSPPNRHRHWPLPITRTLVFSEDQNLSDRRKLMSTLLVTLLALGLHATQVPLALAEKWGTHSFINERFSEPGLSPEDAAVRIRQTTKGPHELRHARDNVIFYIRLKSAYLSQDLKNAMTTLLEYRRKPHVKTANDLVYNMAEFDYYVLTPKVYESYVYYEKTLKSIDDLVALVA